MSSLPRIYTIQAFDAPQHSETLRKILSELESEKRISGFTELSPDDDLSSSISDALKTDDMILIVLTNKIEAESKEIEMKCKDLKSETPGLRVAEILVDNITYENDFITFPDDLRPIRNREDMDEAWKKIGENFKNMFPAGNDEWKVEWQKYLKYAIPLILLVGIVWFFLAGTGPQAHFIYYVGDAEEDTISTCYPPCEILLINESQNYDSIEWFIEDTVFTDRHLRLEFIQPGEKMISLTAYKNGKDHSYQRNLEVKQPPVADFEVRNNGCTAPCNVEFINTSANAVGFSWDFGNGMTSEENEPEVRYQSPNEYEVTLISQNSDGITSETKKSVTIIQDDSPFADFTVNGNRGPLPRVVTFSNESQNGDSYIWEFQTGEPSASTTQNPSVTYNNYGQYTVRLTTRKNDGRSDQELKVITIGPIISLPDLKIPDNLRQLQIQQDGRNVIQQQFNGLN